jgi:hypothetical protein
MKVFTSGIGILLLLCGSVLVYERYKTDQLQSALDALAQDNEALNTQLKNLERGLRPPMWSEVAALPLVRAIPPDAASIVLPAAPAGADPVETPGVSVTAPSGWAKYGSNTGAYIVGVDDNQTWDGMPSAYVSSNDAAPNEFGGMIQKASPEPFIGQRVRLSGWIKTQNADEGGGHLWFQVDGQQVATPLQFDDMADRPVRGTHEWQECSVVLDVPFGAAGLAYGFFMKGGGKMWVSGAKLETVGPDVPSTNKITVIAATNDLPKTPVNLDFLSAEPE